MTNTLSACLHTHTNINTIYSPNLRKKQQTDLGVIQVLGYLSFLQSIKAYPMRIGVKVFYILFIHSFIFLRQGLILL